MNPKLAYFGRNGPWGEALRCIEPDLAAAKLGGASGYLQIIYPHQDNSQILLVGRLCREFDPAKIILRLDGRLPQIENIEDWIDGFYNVVRHFHDLGGRMIQLSNEPNHKDSYEGPPQDYALRWRACRMAWHKWFPDIICVWPGIVPWLKDKQGYTDVDWIMAAVSIQDDIDCVGLHAKWQHRNEGNALGLVIRDMALFRPDMPFVLSEWGCTGYTSQEERIAGCVSFLTQISKPEYTQIKLACYFILASSSPEWQTEVATENLLKALSKVEGGEPMPNEGMIQIPIHISIPSKDKAAWDAWEQNIANSHGVPAMFGIEIKVKDEFYVHLQAIGQADATPEMLAFAIDRRNSGEKQAKAIAAALGEPDPFL